LGEIIIDSRGNYNPGSLNYAAGVSEDNYLFVVGSIISQPASTGGGSESFNFVQSGNGAWIAESEFRSVITSGINIISGIVNLGSNWGGVGSVLTIGSVSIVNASIIGSVQIQGVSGTAFNTVWVGVA